MEEKNMRAAKKLAILGVSTGVAYVITQAVKTVCPVGGTVLEKTAALIGGGVLSAMVADKAGEFAEKKIDEAVQKFEENVTIEIGEEEEVVET